MAQYLGIEIGGTKIQLGIGAGDGILKSRWRGEVNIVAGAEGIRQQLSTALPEVMSRAGITRGQLQGAGIGFGGPVDDANQTVIKSHHIEGWENFPLADWVSQQVGAPAILGNDADVAGLGEAWQGAGKGLSPIFYITIGTGIGGGFIVDGEIYRGSGRGAAEIGHLRMPFQGRMMPLEQIASGWGIQTQTAQAIRGGNAGETLKKLAGTGPISATVVALAAEQGDPSALQILNYAWEALAEGICHVIALLCPRRIVIGGGVSLIGDKLLFEPLRTLVAERVFQPFAGLTDIVPAALGEEVVVHGALALSRRRYSGE